MRSRRAGVVLILIASVSVIFVLLAMAFLQFAKAFAGSGQRIFLAAAGELSAGSGMHYAAARLGEDPLGPRTWTPENRGEDWRARLDEPLSRDILNPSYAHGENWTDGTGAGTRDGAYDKGIDPVAPADRDANGRFSAWTGRLRGGGAPFGCRFALRIDGLEGRIPLNAGCIRPLEPDGMDDNSNGQIDEPAELSGDMDGDGIPDWRDLTGAFFFYYHAGLAHALNNLGVACGIEHRRKDIPAGGAGGQPIQASWLGYDLISSRPQGGYRSWEEVRSTLLGLPLSAADGGPYTEEDLAKIRPFLDLGPYPESTRACAYGNVPVSLAAASPEVLRAAWMYVALRAASSFSPPPGVHPVFAAGGAASFSTKVFSRAGSAPLAYRYSALGGGRYVPLMIFPDDAERLADLVEDLRLQGRLSWSRLYAELVRRAKILPTDPPLLVEDILFPVDASDLAADIPLRDAWMQAKADLAFQTVSPEYNPWPQPGSGGVPAFPAFAWGSWGLDRDRDPANGVQQRAFLSRDGIARVRYPASYATTPPWGADAYFPYRAATDRIIPLSFTCAPPVRFHVESGGASSAAGNPAWRRGQGDLAVGERLELTSQEDFENWREGRYLAPRGIGVHDPPLLVARRRDPRTDRDRTYPHVVTLPDWSRRAYLPPGSPAGYAETHGAVALAAREAGQQATMLTGAGIYFPLSEDFNGQEDTAAPPPEGEFWRSVATWYLAYDVPFRIPVASAWQSTHQGPYYPSASGMSPPFQCPGLHLTSQPGAYLEKMTIEGWFNPSMLGGGFGSAQIQLRGSFPAAAGGGSSILFITAFRSEPTAFALGGRRGIIVNVNVPNWRREWGGGTAGGQGWYFIEDKEGTLERARGARHIAVVFEAIVSAPVPPAVVGHKHTQIRVLVDGEKMADGSLLNWSAPVEMRFELLSQAIHAFYDPCSWMLVSDTEQIMISRVDDVRLWADALSSSDAEAIYRQDRYVRQGTFSSPVYVVPEGASISQAQWTGIVPPVLCRPDVMGTPDPARPIDPFQVVVEGFRRPPDPGEDPDLLPLAAGFPVVLGKEGLPGETPLGGEGSGTLYAFSALPKVSAFRYKVRFDCREAAGVLNDTPVFESIWLAFRRYPARWSTFSME